MKFKITKFDIPLIGLDINEGYRIKYYKDGKFSFKEILNYGSCEFGELVNELKTNIWSKKNDWKLIKRRDCFIIVLKNMDQLKIFCKFFNINHQDIDISETVSYQVKKILNTFFHQPVTFQKIIKIRESIRKKLKISIENVLVNADVSNVKINIGNQLFSFDMSKIFTF